VTGDVKEAHCVLDVIDSWAKARALLNYNASDDPTPTFAEVGWTTASLALAYSVIETEPTLDPAKKTEAVKWLRDVAHKMTGGSHRGDAPANKNNLSYWRGLAATAVGVISSDDELFTWGLAQYERAIEQLNDAGAWPLEMARKELAIHYESFALEPLVMIAELAARQGINLYIYRSHRHTLQDAVQFVARAIHDPAQAEKLSSSEQDVGSDQRDFLSWLEFWNRRFGDAGLPEFLDRPWFAARLSGSTTLYAAAAQ
jgi:poly(beta-D-mannuronate) lyase